MMHCDPKATWACPPTRHAQFVPNDSLGYDSSKDGAPKFSILDASLLPGSHLLAAVERLQKLNSILEIKLRQTVAVENYAPDTLIREVTSLRGWSVVSSGISDIFQLATILFPGIDLSWKGHPPMYVTCPSSFALVSRPNSCSL
jgi:hypothetical protein